MAFIGRAFSHAFKTYPAISNSLIYGTLYVTAEFSQQTILKKVLRDPKTPEPPYDTGVLKRYGVMGTCAISPTLFYWYKWLDGKYTGTAIKTIARKCILDQFLMTPIILGMFYTGMSIMEGRKNIFEELRKKFAPTFATSCCFWIPIQALNFGFIPPQFRVVYISVCTLVWVNILCYFKRQKAEGID